MRNRFTSARRANFEPTIFRLFLSFKFQQAVTPIFNVSLKFILESLILFKIHFQIAPFPLIFLKIFLKNKLWQLEKGKMKSKIHFQKKKRAGELVIKIIIIIRIEEVRNLESTGIDCNQLCSFAFG